MKTVEAAQIGGTHYQSEYQHWTWAPKIPLSYLAGCATKYVVRWRYKEGLKDLRKALSFLNKMILEEDLETWQDLRSVEAFEETRRFAKANNLTDLEAAYVEAIATWTTVRDLEAARELLFLLMDEAEARETVKGAVPLEDSNRHADRVGS